MFVDHIKISAKAGDGGSGVASFRREKFVPKGGPDGGDGGRGGDVILRPDPHTDNLVALYYEPIVRAKDGERGRGKQQYGKSAPPKVIAVPIGTIVYRLPRHETAELSVDEIDFDAPKVRKPPISVEELEVIADLTEPGQEFVLCKGGTGGRGNIHFKSSRNRAPTQFKEGEPGEGGEFYLELRKIADAGLVGYPNAGKSTLLGRISAAHPKVAPYPFTTMTPMIGVVEFPGFERATVADIPGLVEGAHRNVGLGHDFLRHIVRCKLLLFVLDMAGSEGRNPLQDLATLREELKLYDPQLAERPWAIVANKMDLAAAKENLRQFKGRFRRVKVLPVAAEMGTGIEELKQFLQAAIFPRGEKKAAAAAAAE